MNLVFPPEGKEEPPAASATALADFGKRKTLFYLADSAVLHQVQELLPGAYGVAYLEAEGSLVARFTDEYSVSGLCERNTQLAGMMFINYLFSDYAQNVLYTQRDAGLPLNRAEFEKYVTETNNDFEPLLLSLIHISEPTRLGMISYAVFCLKKKKKKNE